MRHEVERHHFTSGKPYRNPEAVVALPLWAHVETHRLLGRAGLESGPPSLRVAFQEQLWALWLEGEELAGTTLTLCLGTTSTGRKVSLTVGPKGLRFLADRAERWYRE